MGKTKNNTGLEPKQLETDGQDVYIECKCSRTFIWTVGEQLFYKKHNLVAPKKCPICRNNDRKNKSKDL